MEDKFYLGRIYDPEQGRLTDQPLLYDPDDLTTHAVVVGMTGSGKTGLCITLLEEAALRSVPALMIDPKGDITNALLHFPELRPEDFQPWVNPDEARRAGLSMPQAGEKAASAWRDGLAEWGIGPERLQALAESAHFAVYTPGSDAGLPVSILASLKAPALPWDTHRELLREKISGTVTALLGLVGLTDLDPVRSREHILLANIFETAWKAGRDLDLSELILQTQSPPFTKLGVFEVNTFFPEKDRFELAMQLNNILAAPSFAAWIEGQPLDIPSLLYGPDGRPRHSVFYIAHLSDAERMFFVALLYSAVESWMRAQPGATSLRALLYFDEIFGYLPPLGNPPSKPLMLRMQKQARAFGVGQVLASQNPVDVDYKGLSNAGTWFIGKLQTEQDKARLLDGLQGAAGGTFDRGQYDRLISSLGKRVFLMHNVHRMQPAVFGTRWAMNFLAGPLTRAQIPAVNALVGAGQPGSRTQPSPAASVGFSAVGADAPVPAASWPAPSGASQAPASPASPALPGSPTRPPVPAGITEVFLPNNLTFTQAFEAAGRRVPAEARSLGLIYRPAVLAQAAVRFLNRKYGLDTEIQRAALVPDPDRRGAVHWEDYPTDPLDRRALDGAPDPQARFAALEAPFSEARILTALQKDFTDWVYRSSETRLQANEALKVYAGPDVSPAEFRQRCTEAARQGRDHEHSKTAETFDKKIAALQAKHAREQRELAQDESELDQRKWEERGTHMENLAGLIGFGRKRSLTTSLSKRRMTDKAKADVEESLDAIADFEKQIAALEKEKENALEEITGRWGELVNQTTEIPLTPARKDVLVDLFAVAWVPYHLVQAGGETMELPGFAPSV